MKGPLFTSRGVSINIVTAKVMTAVEAAYVAGFLDGEGTITIGRERRAENRSGFRYKPLMNVANTHRGALERIRDICGNGRIISNYHSRPAGHKEVFVLLWNAGQIRHILPQIQPYLLVKSEQAATMADFLTAVRPGENLTISKAEKFDALRNHIRKLNHRGLPVEGPEEPIGLRAARYVGSAGRKRVASSSVN